MALKRHMDATIICVAAYVGSRTVDTMATMYRNAPIRKLPVKRIGLKCCQ
jgi:hypothetical protein